ncbi:MAG: DUF3489 domain-containing protein [Bryobacteraceae bacterium]|jgi:hypothetical protein
MRRDAQNSLAFRAHRSDPCRDRGDFRPRSKHEYIDYRRNRQRPSPSIGQAAESHQKGACCATWRPRCEEEGESAHKATPAKKAPKGAKKATGARDGSKTNKVLELLKRPGGVMAKELMKVTGWQPHSVRGFLSGTIRKKMGLAVTSSKSEDGERSYSIKA